MTARSLTVTASPSPRTRRVLLTAFAGLALACATALAGPAQALAACPNEALRAESRSTQLAQCRAYELVSPVETQNSGVQYFAGAAPDGEAAEFLSQGAFAGAQSGYLPRYIARRVEKVGWQTASVAIPGTLGGVPNTVDTSFDLTKQLAEIIFQKGEKKGVCGMFLSGDLLAAPALSYVELSDWPSRGQIFPCSGYIEDASPNFADVLFHRGNYSPLVEISGAGGPAEAERTVSDNAVAGNGQIQGGTLFHAVSNDGAEVFFTPGSDGGGVTGESYVSVNRSMTLPLGGLFQGASEDGSKVFLRGEHLNLVMDTIDREPGHEAITETVPISGASLGLYVRSSDDGSHVYFVSNGPVLAANKNENGEEAVEGELNLYVYDTLTKGYAFIARTVPGGELFTNIATGYHVEAQVNGCPSRELGETVEPGCEGGRFFVFTTEAHITPGDTAGGRQVFEYDAKTGHLARVSTGEGGYANNGNDNALGASIAPFEPAADYGDPQPDLFGENARAVSDDGSTVVFSSPGALSPRAVNDLQPQQPGPVDVYESHDGQVSLVSTGHSLTSDEQPAITPAGSGRDIFFTSTEDILPQKSDGLKGLWDARIEGGFPAALVPEGGCNGDSCQGPPSVPDLLGASGSATFSGLGNPTPAAPTPAAKPKAKPKPKQCKKGYTKKKNRCVKAKKKHKAAKSSRRVK
jgi:hypothetical protein